MVAATTTTTTVGAASDILCVCIRSVFAGVLIIYFINFSSLTFAVSLLFFSVSFLSRNTQHKRNKMYARATEYRMRNT